MKKASQSWHSDDGTWQLLLIGSSAGFAERLRSLRNEVAQMEPLLELL